MHFETHYHFIYSHKQLRPVFQWTKKHNYLFIYLYIALKWSQLKYLLKNRLKPNLSRTQFVQQSNLHMNLSHCPFIDA